MTTINMHNHSDHHGESTLSRIAKGVVSAYDWLSGPAMSEQERLNQELLATEPIRRIGPTAL